MKLKAALLILIAGVAWGDVTSVITLPGGTNESVQTNKNGRFNGDSYLTYSTSTKRLTVPGLAVSTITINGVPYYFPFTQGAGGTSPINDGAGGITWAAPTVIGVSTGAAIAVQDNGVNISSPTSVINFYGPQFIVSLPAATTSLIKLDPSTVTLLGASIDLGSEVNGSLPAASIAAGSLGSSVLASSVAVGSVKDSAITSLTGSKVSGDIPGNAAGITGTVNISQVVGAVSVYPATATASFTQGFTGSTFTFPSINATTSSATVTGAGGFRSIYGIVTSSHTVSTITVSGRIVLPDGTVITSTSPFGGTGGALLNSTQTWTGGNVYQGYTNLQGSTTVSLSTLSLDNGTTFYENGLFVASGGVVIANIPIGTGALRTLAVNSSSAVVITTSGGGSGTPGGSSGQMQYNSASAFAGSTYTVVQSTGITFYPPFSLVGLSTVTFGTVYFDLRTSTVVAGSVTVSGLSVNGEGDGEAILTIFGSTYTVASSSVIPAVGHLAVYTSTWGTIGDGGTGSAGTPGSPVNSVQFNSAGAFGGSANFNWSSSSLTVVGAAQTSTFSVVVTAVGSGNSSPGILDVYAGNVGAAATKVLATFGTDQQTSQVIITDRQPVSMVRYGADIGELNVGKVSPNLNKISSDQALTQYLDIWNSGAMDIKTASSGNGGKDIILYPQQVEAARFSNTNGTIFASSVTVYGAAGARIKYEINAGSITGAGLSTCGDLTHGLSWTDGLFGCQSITGSGGSASTLAVGTGTSAGFTPPLASSPTAVVLFDQSQLSATLQGGATAFISIRPVISTPTANFTFASTSTVANADATGGSLTVTLPTAIGITGKKFTISRSNSGANTVTIATTSSQTINGDLTVVLTAQWASIDIQSDGANWRIQ